MDTWKYFDITHRDHIFCNPMSLVKFQHLISLLDLSPKAHVLEIATGKGEFIIQLAERYGISGVGVDISPFHVDEAKQKVQNRVANAKISFLEMDGASFKPEAPESYDLTACIGASWIFNGHKGTLQALAGMIKPNGIMVVGEPYWLLEPDPSYLEAADLKRTTFGTHNENVLTGEEMGLNLLSTVVSNHDDWDVYEGFQWNAAEKYALEHPDDPDVPELLRRIRETKHEYLKWGRDTLGWAIYVFRKDN